MQPIPEKEYVRIIYVGRMVLQDKDGESKEDTTTTTLADMIDDIWKTASVFNKANFIGGHLVWTEDGYVGQLLEGSKDVVFPLLERIKKDPRVVIDKLYSKDLLTMNAGWEMSMCYSFQKTRMELDFIDNADVSLDQVFDEIKNTHKIKHDRLLQLRQFYMHTINMFTMKYMSVVEQQRKPESTANIKKLPGLGDSGPSLSI